LLSNVATHESGRTEKYYDVMVRKRTLRRNYDRSTHGHPPL